MKEFRLERITYRETEAYASKGAVVILPVSPLEAHGPHLPLGVDFFGASKMAELSATILNEKGIPAVVAPVLPYANAQASMPFAGTVSLKTETVKAIITDIATSFNAHGFKGTAVVCQHLERPNLKALQDVSSELSTAGTLVMTVNPFEAYTRIMNEMMKGEFPELDRHAGEWETAFCLWACPEMVKQEMVKDMSPVWIDVRKKIYHEGCKDFLAAGGLQCYFGDPSCATPELGKKIYDGLAECVTEEIQTWLESAISLISGSSPN